MTTGAKILTSVAAAVIVVLAFVYLVDVDVDGDVELPNIEVSGGDMPAVDVNTADINVQERQADVEVPTGIETETRQVPYPDVNVTLPEENTTAEENDLQ